MADVHRGFMFEQIPRLLRRFSLCFTREDTCMEYMLTSRKTMDDVSQNLIISHDRFGGGLYISKFYPQLFLRRDAKYLSAACFYLMIHHGAGIFGLTDLCRIRLETEPSVYDAFYARLPEFEFHVAHERPAGRVCLEGNYHFLPIATEGIRENKKLFL